MNKNIQKKNFIWNAIGLTFNCFNSLFFLIIVTRINGLNEAGIFTYAFSLSCLFYFISLYFNRTYQISDNKHEFNDHLSTRLFTSLASLVVAVLFGIISGFNAYKIIVIVLLVLFKVLEAISDVFYGYIHKNNELHYVGKSMFIKAIGGLALFALIDLLTNSIIFAIFGLLLINTLIMLLDIRKYTTISKTKIKLNSSSIKRVLFETFSIFSFTVLGNLLCNMQKYVMTYEISNELQTIFGIIIMPATILSLVGSYLLNPYITKLNSLIKSKNYLDFDKLKNKIIIYLTSFGLFALIVCYFIGIPVLNIIYNIELAPYKNQLLIVVGAAVFMTIINIISGCLTLLNINKKQLYVFTILTIISLGTSIAFINAKGINGAVIAYLVTYLIGIALYAILYRKEFKKIKASK